MHFTPSRDMCLLNYRELVVQIGTSDASFLETEQKEWVRVWAELLFSFTLPKLLCKGSNYQSFPNYTAKLSQGHNNPSWNLPHTLPNGYTIQKPLYSKISMDFCLVSNPLT